MLAHVVNQQVAVPANPLGRDMRRQPPVVHEVENIDLADEDRRNRREHAEPSIASSG